MDNDALYQHLKELHQHLISRQDSIGVAILKRAIDLVQIRTLSDVSESELVDFLKAIEETEPATTDPWVSSSALQTPFGMVTRRVIEKEIDRRVVED